MKKLIHRPQDLFAVIFRRKNLIAAVFLSLMALVTLVTLLIPNIYESESLILVQPRDVPESVVKEFITVDPVRRLAAIQETVLSRSNLMRVMNEFQQIQFTGIGLTDTDRIAHLRNRIHIDIKIEGSRSDETVSYFKVGYRDRDPALAQRVTSRLTSLFIEHDAKTRENQVYGTVEFLRGELDKVSSRLEESEKTLTELKDRYRYEMPEQLEPNLRTLDRLQEQLKANTEAYDRYVSMKLDLERQLSETSPVITKEREQKASLNPVREKSPLVEEYEEKERRLNELKSHYTEKHPDIIRLEAELKRLKSEIPPEDWMEVRQPTELEPEQITQPNPVYSQLTSQLRQVNTELEILAESREWIQSEIGRYSSHVQNTPEREQRVGIYQRQYDDLKKQHEDLKQKLADAELAESLESRQKGEQFLVIDPANFPQEPVKPNRLLILLAGLGISLAIATGLALGIEFAGQKVWNQWEIEEAIGLPVIGEVPEILTDEEATSRRRRGWMKAVAFAVLFLTFAGFIYGIYATPELRALGSDSVAWILKW